MRIRQVLALLLALTVAGSWAQEQNDEPDPGEVTREIGQQDDPVAEEPPQFVPKEKISPDQVIAFPADI